jgi:hypothetical protein
MSKNRSPLQGESREVAERAANAIREYWLAKGAKVKVWVEPVPHRKHNNTLNLFVVKSEGIPCRP